MARMARTSFVVFLLGGLGLATVVLSLAYLPSVALLGGLPAFAEEEPPEEPPATGDGARALTDEEADELEDVLKDALRAREVEEVFAGLDQLEGLSHASFQKPLVKLLGHKSLEVAERAAELLSQQIVEDERDRAKLAKDIWKAGWSDRANKGRWLVQGRTLEIVGTLLGEPVDNRQFKDVERMWRQMHDDPRKEDAPAVEGVAAYVIATKDGRLFKTLALALDEPGATDVDSGFNPPAEWWERRWHLWKQSKAAIADALTALSGEMFKGSEQAKAWADEHGREHGIDW